MGEAIQSILDQDFHNFEVVVVDDGSTDRTPDILESYRGLDREGRIRVHRQERGGAGLALNTAARLAQSDLFAWMDADDVALPYRLRRQIDFLAAHPTVGVVGGDIGIIDQNGAELLSVQYPREGERIRAGLERSSQIAASAAMMRRIVFEAVGGCRQLLAPAEDYDLWLRIAERFEMANLPCKLLLYRVHATQASVRDDARQVIGTVAAQISAEVRRSSNREVLSEVGELTLEALETVAEQTVSLRALRNRIMDVSAGRAILLSLLDRPVDAIRLLDWAADACRPTRLHRALRAKARLAYGMAYYAQRRLPRAAAMVALSAVVDPMFVLRSGLPRAGAFARRRAVFASTPMRVPRERPANP